MNRIACMLVGLSLLGGASVAQAEATARMTFAEFREVTQQVRRLARAAATPRVSAVTSLLRGKGSIDAGQAYFLYRTIVRRFPRERDKKALASGLIRSWRPNARWNGRGAIYVAFIHMHAAASDGKLTEGELGDARQALQARVTERVARNAVNRVRRYRTFAAAIEAGRRPEPRPDANPTPRPRGPRANLKVVNQILVEHFGGRAQYVDKNADGRIDGGDAASVNGRERTLGKKLARQVLLQQAMVKVVDRLVTSSGKVRMEFVLVSQTRFDRRYFRPDSRSYILQRGVKASQALDHFLQHAEQYGMECATAISVVHYAAIREAYREDTGSDALFDRQFKDMRIGQLTLGTENHLRAARVYQTDGIRIGDHGYFSTPDVDPVARDNGWNGENVIYLGGGRYFGHPFGITDAATIIEHLNGMRRRGLTNPRPATLQRGQIRLDPAALWE